MTLSDGINGIKEWCEMHDSMMAAHRPENPYSCPEAFVLAHGREYEGRPAIPERYAHLMGEFKNCYGNATMAAHREESLTYVEGLAVRMGMPVNHAWCIDEEGKVVEVTWRFEPDTTCGYCGGLGERREEVAEADSDEEVEEDDGVFVYYGDVPCFCCSGSGEYDNPPENVAYLGVPFETDFVAQSVMKKGTFGVIEGLLTEPFEQTLVKSRQTSST